MSDPTESARRQRQADLNSTAAAVEALELDQRALLEAQYGQVWSTDQLCEDFEVLGFLAPYVVVRRRSDRQRGSLEFQHHPRFYFNFRED